MVDIPPLWNIQPDVQIADPVQVQQTFENALDWSSGIGPVLSDHETRITANEDWITAAQPLILEDYLTKWYYPEDVGLSGNAIVEGPVPAHPGFSTVLIGSNGLGGINFSQVLPDKWAGGNVRILIAYSNPDGAQISTGQYDYYWYSVGENMNKAAAATNPAVLIPAVGNAFDIATVRTATDLPAPDNATLISLRFNLDRTGPNLGDFYFIAAGFALIPDNALPPVGVV